jgi:hypothetical protein
MKLLGAVGYSDLEENRRTVKGNKGFQIHHVSMSPLVTVVSSLRDCTSNLLMPLSRIDRACDGEGGGAESSPSAS